MATIELRVDDFEDGVLPRVCASSGEPADGLVPVPGDAWRLAWPVLLLLFGPIGFVAMVVVMALLHGHVDGWLPLSDRAHAGSRACRRRRAPCTWPRCSSSVGVVALLAWFEWITAAGHRGPRRLGGHRVVRCHRLPARGFDRPCGGRATAASSRSSTPPTSSSPRTGRRKHGGSGVVSMPCGSIRRPGRSADLPAGADSARLVVGAQDPFEVAGALLEAAGAAALEPDGAVALDVLGQLGALAGGVGREGADVDRHALGRVAGEAGGDRQLLDDGRGRRRRSGGRRRGRPWPDRGWRARRARRRGRPGPSAGSTGGGRASPRAGSR